MFSGQPFAISQLFSSMIGVTLEVRLQNNSLKSCYIKELVVTSQCLQITFSSMGAGKEFLDLVTKTVCLADMLLLEDRLATLK